jgi:hypothetical protein
LKTQIKSRDGNRCLCCGNRKQLQVDHIRSFYSGGSNQLDNLQPLCRPCNQAKGIEGISFRVNKTPLSIAPGSLPKFKMLSGVDARSHEHWEWYLRRTVNLFYRCSAVESAEIGQKGDRFRHWNIRLFKGNDDKWLNPHLNNLVTRIREARLQAGRQAAPDTIRVSR